MLTGSRDSGAQGMNVLVEGADPDACALARFLAGEGSTVRIASSSHAEEAVADLADLGIMVEAGADLDRDPGPADIAYLDVWTPEIAPRVQRLRAQGTRISCLGELLLERWRGPTIGITGTAGKTTTTSLVASILRAGGVDVAMSAGARAGNLWPTGELLDVLADQAGTTNRVLLLELTSSHLAFMRSSPTIAAIVSFWPDHLELHGDLEHYHAAKATIAAHQGAGDTLVLNADDAAASFATHARGQLVECSSRRSVMVGAYLDTTSSLVLVARDGTEESFALASLPTVHSGNVVAAAAIGSVAGASPTDVVDGIAAASPLPYRGRLIGRLRGVSVVDDGMAATPMKAATFLAGYPERSIVLIAGGMVDAGGGFVHSTSEESALLSDACDEIARVARAVVVFGPAGSRLGSLLGARGVNLRVTENLAAAITSARDCADGAAAIVFSPLFPVSLADRVGFGALVAEAG